MFIVKLELGGCDCIMAVQSLKISLVRSGVAKITNGDPNTLDS